MKVLFLILTLSTFSPGTEWTEIFEPRKGWTTSAVAKAKGKTLLPGPAKPPTYFTNAPSPKKAGYLRTRKQFGDCTVEAEFMIPKGSNSGIYLMGRYEIQILDSHGKPTVDSGDMGGVYKRWDPDHDPQGFDGVAPQVNAAKPAGQWQRLVIRFRAPRLSTDGKLLEKPRFLSVHLNGKLVQKDVVLHGHTRAAQRTGWAAKDHLFIQGDHGPIVFRKFEVTPKKFPAQPD